MAVNFTVDLTEGLPPLTVVFTSTVEGEVASPIKYYWQFGDGFTSIESNPQHVYRMPGIYTVKLTVTFDDETSLSETKVNYIVVTDVENSEDIPVDLTNKSYRYGLRPEQGYGFSENTGDAWPFPEVRSGVLKLLDDYNQVRSLVYDVNTGHFYQIDTRDGSTTTGDSYVWKDGADVSGNGGTDIQPSVKFKEDRGTFEHFYLTCQDQHFHFRPFDEDNRGESGYDSNGYPSGLTIDVNWYIDGEQTTAKATAEDITLPKHTYSTDKKVTGNRIQTELVLNKSDVQFIRRTQYFEASDTPDGGDSRLTGENTKQENISTMSQWVTRGSTPLLERVGGDILTGTQTGLTGPDSYAESAMNLTSNVSLGNSAITSGQVQLWCKNSGDYVSQFNASNSVLMSQVATQDDWDLVKFEGSIPSGMTLVSGSVFDYRLYDGTLSDNEETYYVRDIQRNSGDTTLPAF